MAAGAGRPAAPLPASPTLRRRLPVAKAPPTAAQAAGGGGGGVGAAADGGGGGGGGGGGAAADGGGDRQCHLTNKVGRVSVFD